MESISSAVKEADCVLLSVKPQNYPEVISELKNIEGFERKLYISIGAGITMKSVSEELCGANVVRVFKEIINFSSLDKLLFSPKIELNVSLKTK